MADPNFGKNGGEPGIDGQFQSHAGYLAKIGTGAVVDLLAIGSFSKAIYGDGNVIETITRGANGIGFTLLSALVISSAIRNKPQ